ncbi:galactofuranose ABC transporter, permease protein YjfF [Homoserinimonas hongtaonis]|uniref:Sugar ABC transporter permease YjfF n=1 Tax=Homoserinimonas hongtaonis TaxID=2079791 RepID=A0A2U1T0J3_9MICO|nr:galactofuranose ABC transporter, permease protein YjfF [Salinibacterium hongtaonis]AWB89917.1 sugar ABC transporter permease YjfF [Salinibacterium hongtaonis]PWB97379.1 sugar ABC transporter permease YjfF [Salinibacterium hongtaonis]
MTTTLPPIAPLSSRSRLARFIPSSRYTSVLVTLVLLVAMFGVGSARYRGFASGQVVMNLFIDNAFLIVLAVGMTFVILTGGIDLSVGAVVALSTMMAASLLRDGWNPAAVIVVVLVATSGLGLLVGLVIHYFDIQPFIATLAAMFLARGLCYVISLDSISITNPFFVSLAQTRIPLADRLSITPSVIIAVVVVAIAFVVLHFTRTGRTVYAIGDGGQSAHLMGLPVVRTKVLVYVISGFCSGIAGILFSLYTLSGYSLTAVGMELDAIAAVVIGGTLLTGGYGFVLGSLLGVLVLGVIQTIISFEGTLSSWWTRIVVGGLLLLFIILQRLLTARQR